MADESEESELGVWISMDVFKEILDHMFDVCTLMQEALDQAMEPEEDVAFLTIVKKPDTERGH